MEPNLDIYNFNNVETGAFQQDKVFDLMKAMNAGDQTGRDLDGVDTAGAALKTESLDPTLRVLTNRDKHIVFWKSIPKQKAYNTVEEYNQLVDYGLETGIFNGEGETPQFTDSIYRRESVLIKYMGISGEVTHPYTLVNLGSGVGNALAKEVQNKTQFLLRAINQSLPTGDSEMVDNEFDGVFKQHYVGVTGGLAVNWDGYFNDSTVIDNRGEALNDDQVEDGTQAVVNDNFGMVSKILANPIVFNDYVKRFHESKRVNVGQPGAVQGATMGQSVNKITTQFGDVDIMNDIFFDRARLIGKVYNAGATGGGKAPAAITPDGSTPVAVVTDAATKFTDGAGDYFYAVTSKNRYGESAMTILDTTAISVSATQSVNLKFTITNNSFPAESFVIYRTQKDAADYTTALFYPILTVSIAQHTSGYDGGAAGLVRDRNRFLPNTTSALIFDPTEEILCFKQLAPMMRMDLARTSPSFRFMVLCYGTPLLGIPKRVSRIVNIGRTITTS
jgi:hypothetical protein